MQDFLHHLGDRLDELADAERAGVAARRHRTAPSRRRPALMGGCAAAGGVIAVLGLTGTSAADLPILTTPTADATKLRRQAPSAAAAGVDFAAAHPFGTPAGPGYVLASEQTDTLCLLVPDSAAAGDFGAACRAPIEAVEREGLAVESPGDRASDPEAVNRVAFVLPEGAEHPQLRIGATVTEPRPDSGVVVFATDREAALTWTVDGRKSGRRFDGPFQQSTSSLWTCPDGRLVRAPMPGSPASPADTRATARAARTRACGA